MGLIDIIKSKENVETKEFQEVPAVSKLLRAGLKKIIIPFSDKENKDSYIEQFDLASRNVEITLEGLAKLFLNNPIKGLYVMAGLKNWMGEYFTAQKTSSDKDRFLVYTEADNAIPFKPEEDIIYTYMMAQVAFVVNELVDVIPRKGIKHVAGAFQDANKLAVSVYNEYQTTVPRFLGHKRISLKIIQATDKPINCCPSLHITYSMLLDNVGEMLLDGAAKKDRVMESIRYSTLRMFNSVLYTKQHSLLDVSFGMLCAKMAFEARFNRKFNDLTDTFEAMQQEHPTIDYGIIEKVYRAGVDASNNKSLHEIVGGDLTSNGYLKVKADEDIRNCYFDTKKKEIVKISL